MSDNGHNEWQTNMERDLASLRESVTITREAVHGLLETTKEQGRRIEQEATMRRDREQLVDERIDKLVSAIGELVRRIPPNDAAPAK